jgi:hypothetical protein
VSVTRRAVAAVVLGVTVALFALMLQARAGEDAAVVPPLSNEDIVRMVASGAPEQDILVSIRSRPEAFDLTNDMVEELGLAGVSATIVAAMRQRHAELAPPAPPVERPKHGRTPLAVTLNAGGAGARTLRVPAWADEDAKQQFQLPKENDQREVKDLAVFLACTSSEHVPDLWRSKSPLGRDMSFVVRHEMLAFVAGETPAGKAPRLVLPERLEAEVDEVDPHDLVLGIAALIGDRWIQLAAARLPKASIIAGQKPLIGRIGHHGHGFSFTVELSAPR